MEQHGQPPASVCTHKNQRRNLYTLHRFRRFSAASTVYVDFHAQKEGPGRLEDHGQGIYRGLRLRPSIGKQTFPPCVGAEKSFVLCRPAYTGGREYPQAVTADSGKTRRLDHHLTTSSSQPVLCIVFYVPTSFYNHQKQRRKLCTPHNFRRWFMLFACLSQFSDSKGQRFESLRPHQEQHLKRCCSFYFV